MNEFSKVVIFFGAVMIAAGLLSALAGKTGGLGHLPGDLYFRRGNFTFYFPFTTCILLSVVLMLIFIVTGKK
jgi:hypothetical protein